MSQYIYENFEVNGLEITEASKESLQEGVLSKVKGPSFFLDGYSRNGRFYPKTLWENALKNPETKQTLERGLMFGCIGHPKDYTLDELLESGKVSHKVTDIYIDKKTGQGIAEYEILDTPSGRILNTVLKSGSKMYVSTRAFGGFTNETKTKDGRKYKVLDDKNFVIESIDFVIQPGFLETDPQLVESIKEDIEALKEDKHNIICEDGLCGLELGEAINENKKEESIDKELLESLSKEEIISMLENVVKENKILSESSNEKTNKIEEEDGDIRVSAKLMSNYIAYVELLTKLVRYNVEYEKYYDTLIEFLDKDSKLTTKDMESLSQICDEILKEKDIDESIEKTCEKIKELEKKINYNGEEISGEENKEEPSEEDNSHEIKAEESFIDFILELKTKEVVVEKVVEKEDTSKIEELMGQVSVLKEATKNLTKQLEEALNKEPEVVTETKIEYKVPEDIHETISREKQEKDELKEELSEKETILAETIETLSETLKMKDELQERLEIIEKEFKEKEESDKAIFKEILEDKDSEISQLEENLEEVQSQKEKIKETLENLKEERTHISEELHETKAKYYSMFYKVELPIVEKMMELYDKEEELQEALKTEEKRVKRSAPMKEHIEIPEYNPRRSSDSEKKTKFLENLVR